MALMALKVCVKFVLLVCGGCAVGSRDLSVGLL